jgi:predicted lipoprotein with Yx(FWY)xxD motif
MSYPTKCPASALAAALPILILTGCAPSSMFSSAPLPPVEDVFVDAEDLPALGRILTDGAGLTLYVFADDAPGVSNCTGACAELWPPFLIPADTVAVAAPEIIAVVDTIIRADGTTQVAVNNQPVYYYAKDKNPGDVLGQGISGKWFVLDSNGVKVTTPAPAGRPASPGD